MVRIIINPSCSAGLTMVCAQNNIRNASCVAGWPMSQLTIHLDQNNNINPSCLHGRVHLKPANYVCSDIQVKKSQTTDAQKTTDVVINTPKRLKSCCLS